MLKKRFSIGTLFNSILNQLLISLLIYFTRFIMAQNTIIESAYPVLLQLDGDHAFLANEDGMHFLDKDLNNIISHEYQNNNINDFKTIVDKIKVAKLDEEYGGDVFCLIVNQIYVFTKNGNLTTIINFSDQLLGSDYIDLIPYKKENNILYFIIGYIEATQTSKNLILKHYKLQESQCVLVGNNYYKPFYLDYTGIFINNVIFTCQIIKSDKLGKKILTCCYQANKNSLIVVQSFDIENNITEIEEYYSKIPIDNLVLITSTVSEDKKNMLVCYSPSNFYGYCFSYNFDANIITNNRPCIEKCLNQHTTFKLNYFSNTTEYVFICLSTSNTFTIVKFNNNFERINPDEISINNFELTGKHGITSLSLMYYYTLQKYAIIADSMEGGEEILTSQIHLINTNFTQHHSSQLGRPEEFIEVFQEEPFIIDKSNKYFVYTEERSVYANSVDDKKVIIDFMDENNLFVKTRDNKPINSSLYSFRLNFDDTARRLMANINGVETIIESGKKIFNITQLVLYPTFSSNPDSLTINYMIFLKNNTQASDSVNFKIYICKENCTCDESNNYCKNCHPNYGNFLYTHNCRSKEELKDAFFDSNSGLYYTCHKMCKTCYSNSYDDNNMNCQTCYTERGDYLDINNNCHEKHCENLFYRDKDTEMKICIVGLICPEEYPNLNSETKECKRNEIIEESHSESETENNSIDSTEKPTTDKTATDEAVTDKEVTDEAEADSTTTDKTTTDKITSDKTTTDGTTTDDLKTEESKSSISEKSDISTSSFIKKNNTNQIIMDIIKKEIPEGKLDEINVTYSTLSNIITNKVNFSFDEDFIISGKNITYQITTTDNQKMNYNQNVSVIDLGECEKIIKRKISYEDDPIPLIILKIDIKKEESRTTAIEYEVYDPYTRNKIDLSICSNVSIAIYAPVSLTDKENNLYNDLSEQGYDLFDGNNSFYLDPCTQYTSENGTDVSLIDRKDYYYNEEIVLCEDMCQYIFVNTTNEKVNCLCQVKDSINIDNNQEFNAKKLLENFYKINTYANFEVLFCYKLVFSSKGLKNNICFYIILVLFVSFLTSMIINLFSAIKKIDDLIFKIFQDRFMYYFMQKIIKDGRKRRDAQININLNKNNDPNKKGEEKPKLSWFQKLKMAKQKKENEPSIIGDSSIILNNINNKTNLYTINDKTNKNRNNLIKSFGPKIKKKKSKRFSTKLKNKNIELEKNINSIKHNETNVENENNSNNQNNLINSLKINENNIDIYNKEIHQQGTNVNNININIINNVMNKPNPPPIKNNKILIESNDDSKIHQPNENINKTLKKKRPKKHKKKLKLKLKCNENTNPVGSNSVINLNKFDITKDLSVQPMNQSSDQKKGKNNEVNKNDEQKKEPKKAANNNIKYIDEELNGMDYDNAIINDNRNYWQYYWSLLKKKHLIILTFISNDDYNVFLLKLSLFILSLALFFSINTLFYKDDTLHTIFSEHGKYNLIYQIPQVLYSTLISLAMSFILKRLSLSQNQLIAIRKELDMPRARQLSTKAKKCFSIKMYLFFSIGLALLMFFWYYVTSFAAVYKNTQLHLIKDTLLSFGLSMIYPFAINFVPGFFRFLALKSENKNKKCLYKTGQIFALF